MTQVLSRARREWLALAILFAGAILRFWKLGDFPFHPDEAIHAWFALDLRHYRYDPTYHGPLLYHFVAFVFAFAVNDFTARLVPAICGVLLLWLALFSARQMIGHCAALWSGALLAFSPVIVAYSRRLLHDSLVLALTFGAVLCFQVALDQPSTSRAGRNARLGLAAMLALFLATKANFFFIVAMLGVFWLFHLLGERNWKFDGKSWLAGAIVFVTVFLLLFRVDALRALPAMIEYWGGQQRTPRLPGPHDYYFRLLLLYELPLFGAAIWGAWCALRKRTPFTDLVLWWSLTSLALYAIANEKVPWLLAHQVLPLALLAGYGLAQIEVKSFARRALLAAATCLALVFSVRHVAATNWENAADHHEPLLFAQTTQAYHDTLLEYLRKTGDWRQRGVWIAPGEQWPAAWYCRDNAPILDGSPVLWNEEPSDESTLRLVIASPQEWNAWQNSGLFRGWSSATVERYVWPRPAWNALRPRIFWRFWRHRQASQENGVLAEQSSLFTIFAAPSNLSN